MDVDGLFAQLETLPPARRVPARPPFDAIVMVAGIEVAKAGTADERSFRRIWRERHGGGATPLLLLDDDRARSGCLSVLGPLDAMGPIRSMEAGTLRDLLVRVSTLPRLNAVREVAADLERLDQAGVPGVKVHDLLTTYTLDARLRGDPNRWAALESSIAGIGAGSDWQRVLIGLGYDLHRRPGGGFIIRYDSSPVAVIHPKADPSGFARLDPDGRPPEGLLLNDARAEGARFGMLASRGRIRLFDTDASQGPSAARYLDLDAGALRSEDRRFLGLLGPDYLANGGFHQLQDEARSFGTRLWRRLDSRIRETVLPVLGRGLGQWADDQGLDIAHDPTREELRRAALTLVFRVLFILYAEGARFLPTDHESYRRASLSELVAEAVDNEARLDSHSTVLWDGFVRLVKAMRSGNRAWGVPPYNGALFAPTGFEGAELLERCELTDPDFGRVLIGLGWDPETGSGVDYSTLEIGHLGHIYEGLLALRLSVADVALRYQPSEDRYIPLAEGECADVRPGELLWQKHAGRRKTEGIFYTRSELIRHLVRQTVIPAFQGHLNQVRAIAQRDPAAAAEQLFDFAVLDPACGSAHFLVHVTNELADLVVSFLADTPLPAVREVLARLSAKSQPGVLIEDVALLRRLVLKRCVFGVDLNVMGAEIAKLSLWLTAFVPGLSLAYLDRNVQVGNSLIGVADPRRLRPPARDPDQRLTWEDQLDEAIIHAAAAALRVATSDDRTPEEIRFSEQADRDAQAATANLQRLFHLWTAEPFGLDSARQEVELHGAKVVSGATSDLTEHADALAEEHCFFHWLPAFPQVFRRPNPGFDAVVGNPPWDEVTVERLSFYALHRPGIRALPEEAREAAIADLIADRPDLPALLAAERARTAQQRGCYGAGEYASMAGDPNLYKYFCQRYQTLLRDGGVLGVVLPRSAFVSEGLTSFRTWLFERTSCERVDFLINNGRWAFDSEPRSRVALVAARKQAPGTAHQVRFAGPATSLERWRTQANSPGLALSRQLFAPGRRPPLLGLQAQADVYAKMRHGARFPHGASGRWRCFPVAELHETKDRGLWRGVTIGWPLWKGESFGQYDPHGSAARACPEETCHNNAVRKPKPGQRSLLAAELPLATRRQAVLDELGKARVAFRGTARQDDSRTVIACLAPPKIFLTNKAPYLSFALGGDEARAACLGLMNSIPFDWQMRRFVETDLNFFILEVMILPDLDDQDYRAIARAAARLSCVDERFADFADSLGVAVGPLDGEERERLRVEIDARVARAWSLTPDDLEVMYADFTERAVPLRHRERLTQRLIELG